MTSEKKVRVETPYGVKIFQNFHFQKHAPIWDMCRVKKFSIQIPKETPNFRFYTQQNQQDDTQMTNST